MESEYLVRARLGMVGDSGIRTPGLGMRPMLSSSPKNGYLLDALPNNKRPRPADADAVTLDNFHASKRYLTEMMASSLNLLKVGDSKDDGGDNPPMSELLSSSLPSEGAGFMEQRLGSLPRYSSAISTGDDMMSNQGDSAMSDDNADTDDDSSPGSWRRHNMMMQEAQFKSPEGQFGPDGFRRRPPNGGLFASNLAVSSLANPIPPPVTGPGAWGIPAHTTAHPYAIPSRHHALQQKEGDNRLPPSPSDPAQSANLRRAALLRSLQMRGQAPTAQSPTQAPSGLGQSVSSGFKLGPSALAIGNAPELRLSRGGESSANEGGEGKSGWVPMSQSMLMPVPELETQEATAMEATGEDDEKRVKMAGGSFETGNNASSYPPARPGADSNGRGSWRLQQLGGAKEWGVQNVKKDLNTRWDQVEKQALSDFRPGGLPWGSQAVRKWGGGESSFGPPKPPPDTPGVGKPLLHDGFGTSPRPKGVWGSLAKSPPASTASHLEGQGRPHQWKGGASNLMEEKEEPLSPRGEAMSPGWGTDTEDFPPLKSDGKRGLGGGEKKVVWKPRLKANSLELTSSPDYGSFTDKGSYMQVARSRSSRVRPSSGLGSSLKSPADPSLSELGTSAAAATPTFGGREKEAPSPGGMSPAAVMDDGEQCKDEQDRASPSIFAPPTFFPPGSSKPPKSVPMDTADQSGARFPSSPRPGGYQSASPEFRGGQQSARQSPLQGSPSPPPGALTAAFNRSFTWSGATTPPPERGLPNVSRGFGSATVLSFLTPHQGQNPNSIVPPTPGAPLFQRRRPSIVIQNSAKDDPPPQDPENMDG